MGWLDSAFPLDKAITEPGVKRGTCPGGESSTPTYVRNAFPDGYVMFANAAIGEIGSTQIGSPGPFPTTPPPPCVEQCSSRPGQNTPECNGKPKDRCQFMAQYENKCQWTECQSTTEPPTTTTPPTSSEPTCEVDRDARECVAQGGSFECHRCTQISGTPCCSCQGGETTTETTTTTEMTQATTTTSIAAGPCKSWCASNAKSWEKKCKWVKCSGCSACSGRRLRGSEVMFL